MKLEIQRQDQTEIYASEQGYCCIKQIGIESDVVVLFAAYQIDEVCRMLQAIKEQAVKNRVEHLQIGEE